MNLSKTTNLIGQILFWGWNFLSLFLCIFLIGVAILPFVFTAALNGEIPLSITICVLILIATPIYAIYFGIKQPRKVVSFFFGVEIPIFILTLFRIFIVRDLTFGSGFLLLSAFVAIGFFWWSLRKSEPARKLNPYVATALSTTVLIAGIYVAVLSGLYAFPLLIEFVKGIFTLDWGREFRYIDGIVIIMTVSYTHLTLPTKA